MSSYRVTIDIADVSDAELLDMAKIEGGNPFVKTPAQALTWVMSIMLDQTQLNVIDFNVEALDPPIEGHEVVHVEPETEKAEP